MKNIIISIICLSLLAFAGSVGFPPSLYDLANREAIKRTGCGIADIRECVKTETGYKVLIRSECGKEDFIIIIDAVE